MPDELKPFFDLLPQQYQSCAYIAGGAAVNLARAGDVDLWLLGVQETQDVLAAVIGDHIDAMESKPNLNMFEGNEYEGSLVAANVKKFGNVTEHLGHNVEILCVSNIVNIEDLLSGFDLSVHQVAYDSAGRRYTLPTTTTTMEPMRIVQWNKPVRTAGRTQKLNWRYGIEVHADDLPRLREAVKVAEIVKKLKGDA